MKNTRFSLPSYVIGSPAEQRSIIEFRSWHVFDNRSAVGRSETVVRHVDRFAARIESPLKEHRILWVGNDFASNAGCFVTGNAKNLHLTRFTIWRVCKLKIVEQRRRKKKEAKFVCLQRMFSVMGLLTPSPSILWATHV